jgi:outer membrane protein
MRLKSFRLPTAALAASLALAVPVAARAQSLLELYEAARSYDAAFLAASAQAASAEFRAAQTGALRLPTVGLTASSTRSGNHYPSDVKVPGSQESLPNTYATASASRLSARQPLYNRVNSNSISQAEKSYEAALTDLETAEQDLILRVAQAYFDVLAAQDTLATTRASKAAITEQLASAKRNFEVGTATITDAREAQARFDLAVAQEIAADNELRNRRIALDQLVGRSAVSPKGLLLPLALPATAPANPDLWVTQADDQHPQVRKGRLAYEIAQFETAKARAGHLPTVDLVGELGITRNTGIVGSVGSGSGSLPGTFRNGAIGVQLNLPIFSGFSTQNRIKETLQLEEKSRNDLEQVRRTVTLNTRVAYNGVQSLQAQVKALEAAEASAKLLLEATQLGFKVGVRVNLDVLNAQRDLFSTQRDLARARYDALVGTLRLRQASGLVTPADVEAVNRLLAP